MGYNQREIRRYQTICIRLCTTGHRMVRVNWTKWNSFKSSLSNFKVPKWISTVGSKIGSLAGGGVFKGLFNGSHATGLERVPYDGYVAELHEGESILTARQSNALRSAGMLSQNSDGTPELNMGSGGTAQQLPTSGGGHQFVFNITGDNPLDIAQKSVR